MATTKRTGTRRQTGASARTSAAAPALSARPAWAARSKPDAAGRIKLPKALLDAIKHDLGPIARSFPLPGAVLAGPDGLECSTLATISEQSGGDLARVLKVLAAREVPLTRLEVWYRPSAAAGDPCAPDPGAARALGAAFATEAIASLRALTVLLHGVVLDAAALAVLADALRRAPAIAQLGVIARRGAEGASFTDLVPALPRLRALRLAGVRLDDAAARALAAAPALAALERLELSANDLSDGGLALVLSAPFVGTLQALTIGLQAGLSDGAFEPLAALDAPNLAALSLVNARPRGVRALASAAFVSRLRELRLRDAALDDASLTQLARAGLPALERLDVAQNDITAAALDPIVRGAPRLAHLSLPISMKARAAWTKRGRRIE